ncbi:MAG: hypothetical protein HOO67_07290 [Candidatus Peribacteraceae bacterium]|nr:hypothetical protein [Candidatus Peribacteraceae bacterium]
MRRLLPALALLALVACTPATPPADTSGTSSSDARVMAGKGLLIRVEKTMTEDAQGIQHTKAVLHVSGVIEKDIDLGDIQGELFTVDPHTYPVYAEQENKPETIGVFTAWWAGQGEEITVKLHNGKLLVDHRYGDEQNTCTTPEQIAEVDLGGDVVVEFENLPDPTAKSSIAFCDTK